MRLPEIVGVVNLSPESPNQDSVAEGVEAVLQRARKLVADGASVIDIGAQSSYFDAPLLDAAEETARLLPALMALKRAGFRVSVDTWRADVAQASIDAGADIINDSDGFQSPAMISVLERWGGTVILPFISGPSPHDPLPFNFDNPMADIIPFLKRAVAMATSAGLRRLVLDPGTGYRYPGVSPADKEAYQLKVYANLDALRALGHPVLVALPRKPDLQRTLELIRMILVSADYVRAHEPRLVAAALDNKQAATGSDS